MAFYKEHILPWLTHLAMRQRRLLPYRSRVIPAATGRVLEIGIGSGLNLPFYREATQIIGVDPSPKLLEMARAAARRVSIPVELIETSAEDLPIHARSIDTVVSTWTLCSIPDVRRAVAEMRRVLKPGGYLLLWSMDARRNRASSGGKIASPPRGKNVSGGCHLNRAVSDVIQIAGFCIERVQTGYMPGPKPMTFMYEGIARPS